MNTICIICKKEFSVKPYRINKAKFCSLKCFGISIKGIHPIGEFKKGQHPSLKTEYKKGNIPLHTGKKRSGIGGRKKGGIPWNKRKEFKQIQGKNHWNWKGGISPEYRKIRHSIQFHLWREKVYLYDDWTCWICEKRGGKLHPHHLKLFSEYPELRFDPNNGITLCEFCHYTYGNHQK